MPIKQTTQLSQVTDIFPWARNEYALGIFVARKVVKTVTIGTHDFQVGWVRDPALMDTSRVAVGVFTAKNHFVPVALADAHARLYETNFWTQILLNLMRALC